MKRGMLDVVEGTRKYTFAWGVFIGCLIALFFGKLEGRFFADVILYIGGAYMIGNVGEHFSKAWQKRSEKTLNPPQ